MAETPPVPPRGVSVSPEPQPSQPSRPVQPSQSSRPGQPASGGEPLWRQVLGDRLRSLRHERGETLTDTAARAGVSPQYLSEIERGIKEPSSEMIAAVAGALEVTLAELAISVAGSLQGATRPVARVGLASRAAYALAA
ncbi:helix-turn-helix domain-containing protein [Solwaraspora sp. WMMB335]|uniref:helix-turn-helix domain-containing protein n=1 Tax=Solwaraspora sp. WMMB335 TaxID=3404118 RepID=UPI003B946C18